MVAVIKNTPSTRGIVGTDIPLIGVNVDAPIRPSRLGNIPHIGPFAVHSFVGKDRGRPYQLDLRFFPGRQEEISPGVFAYAGTPAIRISFAHGTDEQRRVTSTYDVALEQISIKAPGVLVVNDQWAIEYHGVQGRNRHSPQDHQMILEIVAAHKADIEAILNDSELVPAVTQQRMTDPAEWIDDTATLNKVPVSHVAKMADFLKEHFGLDIDIQPIGRGVEG